MLQENVNIKVPVGPIITSACLTLGFKGQTQNKTDFKRPVIHPCLQIIPTVVNNGAKNEERGFLSDCVALLK